VSNKVSFLVVHSSYDTKLTFDHLRSLALSSADSVALIRRAAEEQ
jgi:hypothetical protein